MLVEITLIKILCVQGFISISSLRALACARFQEHMLQFDAYKTIITHV